MSPVYFESLVVALVPAVLAHQVEPAIPDTDLFAISYSFYVKMSRMPLWQPSKYQLLNCRSQTVNGSYRQRPGDWFETQSGRDRKGAHERGKLSNGSSLPKIHGAALRNKYTRNPFPSGLIRTLILGP